MVRIVPQAVAVTAVVVAHVLLRVGHPARIAVEVIVPVDAVKFVLPLVVGHARMGVMAVPAVIPAAQEVVLLGVELPVQAAHIPAQAVVSLTVPQPAIPVVLLPVPLDVPGDVLLTAMGREEQKADVPEIVREIVKRPAPLHVLAVLAAVQKAARMGVSAAVVLPVQVAVSDAVLDVPVIV